MSRSAPRYQRFRLNLSRNCVPGIDFDVACFLKTEETDAKASAGVVFGFRDSRSMSVNSTGLAYQPDRTWNLRVLGEP